MNESFVQIGLCMCKQEQICLWQKWQKKAPLFAAPLLEQRFTDQNSLKSK